MFWVNELRKIRQLFSSIALSQALLSSGLPLQQYTQVDFRSITNDDCCGIRFCSTSSQENFQINLLNIQPIAPHTQEFLLHLANVNPIF